MATTAALVFAGKTIATPAISFIVNKVFSYLSKWHQAEGMEDIKDRLLRRLTEIQAVYTAVNLEQITAHTSSALDQSLWRFRDAVEGAEDALDEVDYYKLEEEAHALEHQVRNPAINFFREKIVYKFEKHISERNMVKKLRKAMEDLDGVAEGVCTFLQLIVRFEGQTLADHAENSDQETNSLVATDIFGRGREKDQIMGWLVDNLEENPRSDRISKTPVISIIGIGGIGKTTLAQIVYKELKDASVFDCIVWAHVSSDTFSVTGITKKILEDVMNKKPNVATLQALQKILKEKLNRKKFLLILDDVWEDRKMNEWEKLMAPLQSSQRGSRILLTTRMESVADMVTSVMKSEKQYLHLSGLDKDDSFALFRKFAFQDMNADDYGHLLSTAEEIVKKFQGCPLVTKIAGGHLMGNLKKQYWENWDTQLKGTLDVIVTTVLRSSYRHLPEDLQLCFRYCSIFPKCYMFKKDKLVKMWMGTGLIPQINGGRERPEDIGEKYITQLARKSFFSFVPTGDPHSKHYTGYYIMHDLLHDLARNVSVGECLRIEDGGNMQGSHTVRHLWIENFSKLKSKEIDAILVFKNLRTLIIENSNQIGIDCVCALERVVENLKGLRLLSLKRVPKFSFAKHVPNKHLRYVSFSGMLKAHRLSKLYHLQVLTADNFIDIEPEQLKKLGNLSCLRYVSYGSNGLGDFHVVRLTSLQELHYFQIQAKEGYKISSLQNLNSLCKLQMCTLENIGNHEEVIEAKLTEKDHLKSLSLNWSVTNGSPMSKDDLVIEKLEPPARLENLEIVGYNGLQFPSWINNLSLINIVSLELRECRNWSYLPALGNLCLLKHLELQKITELKQIGQSPDVSLPPNLRTLVVEGCENLRELPLLPSSLVQLEINKVGLSILPRICDHHDNNMDSKGLPPKLTSVIISNCSNLTSLEGSFLLQEQCVQTLQILNIVDCTKLTRAPLLFGEMNDLTEFRIGSCYLLRMLEKADGGLLPYTLKELSMVQCGDLQIPLLDSLCGLTNLTSLSIDNCSRVKSLPSSEVFRSLRALREMFVTNCIYLSSMGGLGALPDLTWLEITECEKIQLAALFGEVCGDVVLDFSLQVYTLWIHTTPMLEMEPLQKLHNVKNLIISVGCDRISQQWLRQNMMSLESLEILKPEIMLPLQDLSCLKRLEFDRAPRRLPFPNLPSSLESFIIRRCDPQLKDNWTKKGTSEWHKISCIPRVRIGSLVDHFPKKRTHNK
ncbi:hypothetical protein U9M48_001829, partial [Paspalum notatum var. saurae]